jgi:hypothetical protein
MGGRGRGRGGEQREGDRARRVMGIGVGGERVREVRGSPQQTVAGVVVMSLCEGLCVHLRFRLFVACVRVCVIHACLHVL